MTSIDHDRLIPILACPRCRAPLPSLDGCPACGAEFPRNQGVPSLMTAVEREVPYRFTSARSVASDAFRQVFRYPETAGASGTAYHLDLAHEAVLDALPSGARILEIGCGGGQMRSYFARRGCDYVGTDLVPAGERVRDELRAPGGADLLCDAHFLPFADASFDLVYSAGVTEHLASPYLAVQEIARVLKPGGRYLGNVSFLEPWHDDSFFHMSPLGAFELLTQAGLAPEYIWPGRGYSGFHALMAMGNRVTRRLTLVGAGLSGFYNLTNAAMNRLRKRPAVRIEDLAKIAGATDWIARKPG